MQCDRHATELEPFTRRYGEDPPDEPDRLHSEIFKGSRQAAASACSANFTTSI